MWPQMCFEPKIRLPCSQDNLTNRNQDFEWKFEMRYIAEQEPMCKNSLKSLNNAGIQSLLWQKKNEGKQCHQASLVSRERLDLLQVLFVFNLF